MSAWTEARDRQMIADGWVKRPDGYWEQPKVKLGPNYGEPVTKGLVGSVDLALPGADKTVKRIRQSSKPLMNKLEAEWFNICVGAYPEGTKFVPQGIRFKLGNGIWYKPDLLVFGEKVYAYEVKGPFAHRGGFENLKVAAYQYPWIRWSLVWKDKKLHQWQEQEILP